MKKHRKARRNSEKQRKTNEKVGKTTERMKNQGKTQKKQEGQVGEVLRLQLTHVTLSRPRHGRKQPAQLPLLPAATNSSAYHSRKLMRTKLASLECSRRLLHERVELLQ